MNGYFQIILIDLVGWSDMCIDMVDGLSLLSALNLNEEKAYINECYIILIDTDG